MKLSNFDIPCKRELAVKNSQTFAQGYVVIMEKKMETTI